MESIGKTGGYPSWKQQRWLEKSKRKPVPTNLFKAIMGVIPAEASILDMGASTGQSVFVLREHGYQIRGVDASNDIEIITSGLVVQRDLTADCSDLHGSVDWGLFVEVGEHVPKEYESQLIEQVCSIPTEGLIISWATPRQSWFAGHVNCQEESYVLEQFKQHGWINDKEATKLFRSIYCPRRGKRRLIVMRKTS